MSDPADYRYLIIGATVKAATTSLHYCLAAHPDVAPATVKEPRYFLDHRFTLEKIVTYEDDPSGYEDFYPDKNPEKLRLEATPFYLYGRDSAKVIHEKLPFAKMVFILRDPIRRFVSHFNYLKQIAALGRDTPLSEYIRQQIAESEATESPYPPNTLMMGNYTDYLKRYYDLLGADRIHIVFFEEYLKDPQRVVEGICSFAGIDATFFEGFDYKAYNQTLTGSSGPVHAIINAIRNNLVAHTYRKPAVHGFLKSVKHRLESGLGYLDRKESPAAAEPNDVAAEAELQRYYSNESDCLATLTRLKCPW